MDGTYLEGPDFGLGNLVDHFGLRVSFDLLNLFALVELLDPEFVDLVLQILVFRLLVSQASLQIVQL